MGNKEIDVRVLLTGLKRMQEAYQQTCPELQSWYEAGVEAKAILGVLMQYIEQVEKDV